jgi:hypothetical protein
MATFEAISNALKFELKTGESTSTGKEKVVTVSFSNLDPAKTADDLEPIVEQLANVFTYAINRTLIDKRFEFEPTPAV